MCLAAADAAADSKQFLELFLELALLIVIRVTFLRYHSRYGQATLCYKHCWYAIVFAENVMFSRALAKLIQKTAFWARFH